MEFINTESEDGWCSHEICLHTPPQLAHKYLRNFFYCILFLRGFVPVGGYGLEEHDGVPHLVANDDKVRTFINLTIAKIQELLDEGATLEPIYLMLVGNHYGDAGLETWYIHFNTNYEDTSYDVEDIYDFRSDILDINRNLPVMNQMLDFYVAAVNKSGVLVKGHY